MFKSKGGSGPSGAVTSADAAGASGGYASGGATPVAASAPPTPKVKTETRSRCCCCTVARGFLLTLLSLLLLGTLGASIASLAIGPNAGMTRPGAAVVLDGTSLTKAAESVENVGKLLKGNTGEVDLEVRTGYVGWDDKSAASANSGAQTLRALGESPAVSSQRSRIVGYVVLGLLLLSAVAAFVGILSACCCGCSGCALATFAIPFGIVLIASMLAYYFIVNRDVNRYAHDAYPLIPSEKTVVQYPGWAWYLGAASGLLWLLSGCIGCCMPARTKKVTTVV